MKSMFSGSTCVCMYVGRVLVCMAVADYRD